MIAASTHIEDAFAGVRQFLVERPASMSVDARRVLRGQPEPPCMVHGGGGIEAGAFEVPAAQAAAVGSQAVAAGWWQQQEERIYALLGSQTPGRPCRFASVRSAF